MNAMERAFDAAKYGRFSEEPWIELAIPSLADPTLAPAGCHVVSAYMQFAPFALRDTSWDAERERLGRRHDTNDRDVCSWLSNNRFSRDRSSRRSIWSEPTVSREARSSW
jgi:phytoene dehydrogenase-like protein